MTSQPEPVTTESAATKATYHLEHVSDTELLAGTRRLVGRSNQILAELLAHLAEVEARGIHRLRACSSLYIYCVFELRLSEDAAFRRARAAKLARQFPCIFQQIAAGELHLTALILLAPHLTEENHRELLALAKHRTKREVLRIVRTLAPGPSVPDRIEPLGPEDVGLSIPRAATWRSLVESLAPSVRELPPGDRPKDWGDPTEPGTDPEQMDGTEPSNASVSHATLAWPQRYKVQFTVSQAYADLLERAQDLLSHAVPDRSLEEVHLRALRLLVERLEKRKYGAPRRSTAPPSGSLNPAAEQPDRVRSSKKHTQAPRRRGTAAVRREVRDRDGAQCAYVDDSGQRCREMRFLELHHRLAHARGGGETTENLTMFCQAHNGLVAEEDFGREFVEARRQKPPPA